MDIFAHGLWTYAVFHNANSPKDDKMGEFAGLKIISIFNKKRYVWLAVLFGLLPDLLSFGILFAANLINGDLTRGKPALETLPTWIFASYNMTHSIVIFALAFVIIYIITRKWLWPLAAWAMHIITDVPTHSNGFFPTPFLWPISSYRFNGISWATGWFMLLNYGALMLIFIMIAHNRAKEKRTNFKKHRRIH